MKRRLENLALRVVYGAGRALGRQVAKRPLLLDALDRCHEAIYGSRCPCGYTFRQHVQGECTCK